MFIHLTPVHTLILINPKPMNFGYDMVSIMHTCISQFSSPAFSFPWYILDSNITHLITN